MYNKLNNLLQSCLLVSLVATFFLLEQKRDVHTTFVPPAGIVEFRIPHYWLESRGEDEVMVEYRLNGRPIEEFLNLENDSCSVFLIIYSQVYGKTVAMDRGSSYRRIHLNDEVWDIYRICISEKMYGIYTFIVRRYFYNSLGKIDFVEDEIPFAVKLGPSYPGLFGNVHDNADLSFNECWTDDQPVLSEECMRAKARHRLYVLVYLLAYEHFLVIAVFFSPYLLWRCICFLWNRASVSVLDGSLSPPTLDTLVGVPVNWNTFARPRARPQVTYVYDVFLSYDGHDRHLAVGVRHCLRSLGLRVFDCNEDIQPGQPTLLSWNRAMDTSSAFIVIYSAAYVANVELHAQFSAMHNLLLSHEIEADRFLIMATEQCIIAPSLGPLPVIHPFRQGGRRQLEWWALHVRHHSGREVVTLRQAASNILKDIEDLPIEVSTVLSVENGPTENNVNTYPLESLAFSTAGEDPEYDVFLTYCEDASPDCALASKITPHLARLGLRVFDAVHDLPAGHQEAELVSVASRCASFVVLLSPAYRSHPLTRRLHFPQVLSAVQTARVSVDHVLIIRTGYRIDTTPDNTDRTLLMSTSPHAPETYLDCTVNRDRTKQTLGGTASFNCSANNERSATTPTCETLHLDCKIQEHVPASSGACVMSPVVMSPVDTTENRDSDILYDIYEDHGEENFDLHEGLRAFTILAWTGGLADEDYVRQVILWGRAVLRQSRRLRRGEF